MDSKLAAHVMTLANSIIGVSILAMPYCFKQCGIILSIILLIISSAISRLACHFLIKSAMKARLRTFENLAYHVFGTLGKLFIELGMIGFLIGTCIAYFVVIGDLGPEIISRLTETKSSDSLRMWILIIIAIFCIFPLGLLKNVDSLSSVCAATIGFYGCLVLKIMAESAPHLLMGDWFDKVEFWRPAGILQCIPIFSMALCCQTQLFEIYQVIPNASLEKMNNLVKMAVYICTSVYIFVGVFGYIAISHETNFSGNILINFKPSMITEVMKIGFVLSVAFSFPLVIFPCRASLYSLLYKPIYSSLHETSTVYIPENRFRILTIFIITLSLIFGILIPNIELVLGLVGSTIGLMICVIFPATCFICITQRNTNERIIAQIMLFFGIIVMVLGTYANLYAIDNVGTEKPPLIPKGLQLDVNQLPKRDDGIILTTLRNLPINKVEEVIKEGRKEPPQPVAPREESEKVNAEINRDKKLSEDQRIKDGDELSNLQNPLPNKKLNERQENIDEIKKEPNLPETNLNVDKATRKEPPQPVPPLEEENVEIKKEIRKEPPQPVPPVEPIVEKAAVLEVHQENEKKISPIIPYQQSENKPEISMDNRKEKRQESPQPVHPPNEIIRETRQEPPQPEEPIQNEETNLKQKTFIKLPEEFNRENEKTQFINRVSNEVVLVQPEAAILNTSSKPKNDDVDSEAIRKEDAELQAANKETQDELEVAQKKVAEESKKLSDIIKLRETIEQEEKVKQEKLKAIKSIEKIAIKAIEQLADTVTTKPPVASSSKQLDSNLILNKSQLTQNESNKSEVKKPEKVNIIDLLSKKHINTTSENPKPIESQKKVKNEDKEINKMQRDILESDYLRKKRDVDEEHCEKNNSASNDIDLLDKKKSVSLGRDLKSLQT